MGGRRPAAAATSSSSGRACASTTGAGSARRRDQGELRARHRPARQEGTARPSWIFDDVVGAKEYLQRGTQRGVGERASACLGERELEIEAASTPRRSSRTCSRCRSPASAAPGRWACPSAPGPSASSRCAAGDRILLERNPDVLHHPDRPLVDRQELLMFLDQPDEAIAALEAGQGRHRQQRRQVLLLQVNAPVRGRLSG